MANWLKKVGEYLPDVIGAVASGGMSIPLTAVRIIGKEVFNEDIDDATELDKRMNQLNDKQLFELRHQLQKSNSDYKVAALQEETKRLKIQNETYRQEMKDTQDAREKNKGHPMTWVMSLLAVSMFSSVFAIVAFVALPEGNRDIIVYMAGQASGFAATAFVFWLGSARGKAPDRDAR